mgnify:CR=1 FL=1
MRLVFPYLAQAHQILHSLPIAAAIAERHSEVDVHVAAINENQLNFARRLIARHAPLARLSFDLLPVPLLDRLRLKIGFGNQHLKQYTLLHNRHYFSGFDAVVAPERTSLFLRRIGLPVRLIWTRHGAGDREIGFAQDVRQFDFVLMAGRKIEQRLLEAHLIQPGRYITGVYAKFDWAERASHESLFGNERPTVLYNPHFRSALSSWPRYGRMVLDSLAASTRYNLVFAPHVRLFDPPTDAAYRSFSAYASLPHVRIDLGSERSIDMSYTGAANLYLGDVSSQIAEFVRRPRPCVFLDAHTTAWQGNPSYQFWALGPVLGSTHCLESQLDDAFATQSQFEAAQRRYIEDTFELQPGPTAPRGADAIVEFLSSLKPRRPSAAAVTTHTK